MVETANAKAAAGVFEAKNRIVELEVSFMRQYTGIRTSCAAMSHLSGGESVPHAAVFETETRTELHFFRVTTFWAGTPSASSPG